MTKFICDMQDRQISYSAANVQAEILLEALDCVVKFPGDWYTGLNTLSSIYNLYYAGLIDLFQDHMY